MTYGKLTNKLPSVLISHHRKFFISGVIGRSCDFMIYRSNRAGATVTHFWSYHSSRIYICSLFSCLRCINLKKNQLPVQYSTSYFDKLPASLIGMVAKLNSQTSYYIFFMYNFNVLKKCCKHLNERNGFQIKKLEKY